MQKMFGSVFLNHIVLGPLLDQVLQVVGVLLHPDQQALKNKPQGVTATKKKHII